MSTITRNDHRSERASDPGAVARLGRLGAPVRVHRVAEAAGRRLAARPLGPLLDVFDVVPPLEPPQERRLAVEAAVVQRQVLTQEEAGLASRLAALELLEKK